MVGGKSDMASKTQIYKEILREYDALRTEKAAQLRSRREAVYQRLPRVKEIDEELALLGLKAAKLVLQKPSELARATERLKQRQEAFRQERLALLEGAGLSPRVLQMEYACEKCKDTGYIDNQPCTCLKQKLMDKLYDQSNVRRIVEKENFDYYDFRLFSDKVEPGERISPRENAQNILRIGLDFVDNFGKNTKNLLLYGATGLGKTFFCSCIAKELLDAGYVVLYLTAGQLFRKLEEIRFSKNEEEEQEHWDTELLDADLLIIDDLGTEFATLFTASELFRLLNERKLNEKPIIISTNLEPKNITEQYSDRVTSRLREFEVLHFFGEDLRMMKKFRETK